MGHFNKVIKMHNELLNKFANIAVIYEDGSASKVPIVWGNDEKAADIILEDKSKIVLPLLNIYGDGAKYTLQARTLYKDEMNQILEQVVLNFSPTCKIGDEVFSLNSIANNYDNKPTNNVQVNITQFDLSLSS